LFTKKSIDELAKGLFTRHYTNSSDEKKATVVAEKKQKATRAKKVE
jgi:hypothetical protein